MSRSFGTGVPIVAGALPLGCGLRRGHASRARFRVAGPVIPLRLNSAVLKQFTPPAGERQPEWLSLVLQGTGAGSARVRTQTFPGLSGEKRGRRRGLLRPQQDNPRYPDSKRGERHHSQGREPRGGRDISLRSMLVPGEHAHTESGQTGMSVLLIPRFGFDLHQRLGGFPVERMARGGQGV